MCRSIASLLPLLLCVAAVKADVPTFQYSSGETSLTIVGRDPKQGARTALPTAVVPVVLAFESQKLRGEAYRMDATADVQPLLRSPVFSAFPFGDGSRAQYGDALLRSSFHSPETWHTELDAPAILPAITVTVPRAYGYVLTSRKAGTSVGIADLQYVQRAIFQQVPHRPNTLIFALTHNVAFYAEGDATICCSFGTHGTDSSTNNSFVLASYLRAAPAVVGEGDVQAITEHLAEFLFDPLHDPLLPEANPGPKPGNVMPPWMRPASMKPADQGRCAGKGVATPYFLLEPTDVNRKNNFPWSPPFVATDGPNQYHVQNVATLAWYLGNSPGVEGQYSFPDRQALTEPAKACSPAQRDGGAQRKAPPKPAQEPVARGTAQNGHQLIGYWSGYGAAGSIFPLREISPQWDVVIVAFSTPDRSGPEGAMRFTTPDGLDTAQFKADIQYLKAQGKKVLISLGGGGQHFTLAHAAQVPNFVSSVTRIVSDYGFDGIDIDFESPSLSIEPGDTDYRHPTTPSIVNLISALRQLRGHFGSSFVITLVPEGTQIPAGYVSYGGQFGSYLPIIHALRDSLTFADVQDYNTPPLQGLDGEIYQAGSVDYHAAMTELLLHGFPVGGDSKLPFAPMPAEKIAIGFLVGETSPEVVRDAMDYVITGKAPAGVTYRLQKPSGYAHMLGAMFWTIDGDRRGAYNFSNSVGPQLHSYPSDGMGAR